MGWIDDLRSAPVDYQAKYCWARAVEWEMWPAFIVQPLLPIFYLYYPWKSVLLMLLIVDVIWNSVFCTAVVSLPLAAYGMMWAKLKWVTMVAFGIIFGIRHQWTLMVLTLLTPLISPLIGQVVFRNTTSLIEEFMMLFFGNVKSEPSAQVEKYLAKKQGA